MISFLLGLLTGGCFGMMLMCLFAVSDKKDNTKLDMTDYYDTKTKK